MKIVLTQVFTAVVLIGFSNFSFAANIKCPSKKKHKAFSAVQIFDGDPKEMANLAPDNADMPYPHKWTLDEKTHPWLVCAYGPKQENLHQKKITDKVTQCETTESKKGSGVYDSIQCK